MKYLIIALALIAQSAAAESLAYKAATLDAGRPIAAQDRAVDAMAQRLAAVARRYGVAEAQAGNMAYAVAKQAGPATIADLLDAAAIAWTDGQTGEQTLAATYARYAVARGTLDHWGAIHALTVVGNVAARLSRR